MNEFADFDQFFIERWYKSGQEPEAFADWLANKTGRTIIAAPVGEPPIIVAAPDSKKLGGDE